MKFLSKTSLLAASVALLATSCSSDADEDRITNQTLSGYFNIVTNIATGQTEVFTGVSYGVEYNYDQATANISISGLKLPGDVSYPTMTTGNVKWTADNEGWKNVSLTSLSLSSTNFANVPKVNNFVFNLRDRWYNEKTYACSTVIRFDVDETYRVVSMPRQNAEWGTTTVKYANSLVGEYTTDKTAYVYELEPEKGLAHLTINNFSLSADQDILAVSIKDIPCVIDPATGRITLSIADAAASIVGLPEEAEKLKIKDLTMTIDAKGFSVSYICVDKTETYTVSVKD